MTTQLRIGNLKVMKLWSTLALFMYKQNIKTYTDAMILSARLGEFTSLCKMLPHMNKV